jgi:8-oxo-dGTP diphosphatase
VTATTSPALTADMVLIGYGPGHEPHVLLIERGHDPFAGHLALPGGYVEPGETFRQAAARELQEETGVTAPARLHQVGVYDAPDRDPRGRVVSVAYLGILPTLPTATGNDDAVAARWVPLAEILGSPALAFDHDEILTAALALMTEFTRSAR